jgi:hypothetical protein
MGLFSKSCWLDLVHLQPGGDFANYLRELRLYNLEQPNSKIQK